jgi:hypothetical protein
MLIILFIYNISFELLAVIRSGLFVNIDNISLILKASGFAIKFATIMVYLPNTSAKLKVCLEY